MKTRLFGIGLAAALFSGCGGGFLNNFPARTDPADGAILFESNIVDDNTSGFHLKNVTMAFCQPGNCIAHLRLGGRGGGGVLKSFDEHVFLVKLPPGLYSHASPSMGVVGNSFHSILLDRPGGAWKDYKVEPGKVTILGSLDMSIKLALVSSDAGGRTFSWSGSATAWDDRLPAKERAAKMALARPEADASKWKEAIANALAELASAK